VAVDVVAQKREALFLRPLGLFSKPGFSLGALGCKLDFVHEQEIFIGHCMKDV